MIKNSLLVLTSLFIEIYIVENFLHLVNSIKEKFLHIKDEDPFNLFNYV